MPQRIVGRGREGAHATLRPVERLVVPPGVTTDLHHLEEVFAIERSLLLFAMSSSTSPAARASDSMMDVTRYHRLE